MLYKNLIGISLMAATLGLVSPLLADDSVEKEGSQTRTVTTAQNTVQPTMRTMGAAPATQMRRTAPAGNAGGEKGIVIIDSQPSPTLRIKGAAPATQMRRTAPAGNAGGEKGIIIIDNQPSATPADNAGRVQGPIIVC